MWTRNVVAATRRRPHPHRPPSAPLLRHPTGKAFPSTGSTTRTGPGGPDGRLLIAHRDHGERPVTVSEHITTNRDRALHPLELANDVDSDALHLRGSGRWRWAAEPGSSR
jgi:hypothetical protein